MKMNNKTMQVLAPTDIDAIHGGTLPHRPDISTFGRVRIRDREVAQNGIPYQPAPNGAPFQAIPQPAPNGAQAPVEIEVVVVVAPLPPAA